MFGPSFHWNLFDGGRVRNNIRVQEALTEQLLLRYENTVLRALEDVENALVRARQPIPDRPLPGARGRLVACGGRTGDHAIA